MKRIKRKLGGHAGPSLDVWAVAALQAGQTFGGQLKVRVRPIKGTLVQRNRNTGAITVVLPERTLVRRKGKTHG